MTCELASYTGAATALRPTSSSSLTHAQPRSRMLANSRCRSAIFTTVFSVNDSSTDDEPGSDIGTVQPRKEHLAARGGMCRAALADPGAQGDLGRADGLDDVDDAVTVEDRQVRGLADLCGQTVADVLTELDQVEMSAAGARQAGDGEAEPVLAAAAHLFHVAARLQHRDQPRHGRLVHARVRPRSRSHRPDPSVARISSTSSARSTDCTAAAGLSSSRPP